MPDEAEMVTQPEANTPNPNSRIARADSSSNAIFVEKFVTISRILSGTFFNCNK
jgi:hypothetical protein